MPLQSVAAVFRAKMKLQELMKAAPAAAAAGAAVMAPDEAEAGLLDRGLTTTVMERLPQKEVLKRETILGTTQQQGVKGAEAEMIRDILGTKAGMSRSLLDKELEKRIPQVGVADTNQYSTFGVGNIRPQSQLPDPTDTNTSSFRSRLYTVPEEFSVNQTNHFGDRGDLLAWSRSFDERQSLAHKPTRHVVEIQSDLFQRGAKPLSLEEVRRLRGELNFIKRDLRNLSPQEITWGEAGALSRQHQLPHRPEHKDVMADTIMPRDEAQNFMDQLESRSSEIEKKLSRGLGAEKLEPFKKGWHERVLREENRRAAQEGIGKIRVAHPDTVAKVENWKEATWYYENHPELKKIPSNEGERLTGNYRAKGIETERMVEVEVSLPSGKKEWRSLDEEETGGVQVKLSSDSFEKLADMLASIRKQPIRKEETLRKGTEGLYKFYQDDIAKFVQKEFKAKEVKDAQGHKWYEWDVDPEAAKKPVKVWGAAAATAGAGGLMAPSGEVKAAPPRTPSEWIKEQLGSTAAGRGETLPPKFVKNIGNIAAGATIVPGLLLQMADEAVEAWRGKKSGTKYDPYFLDLDDSPELKNFNEQVIRAKIIREGNQRGSD